MKKLRFKSFATRLSVFTIIFTIIIFTIIMIIFYSYSRQVIIKNAVSHTHSLLSNMAIQLDDKLNMAETALINCDWIVKDNLENPDSLYKIINSLVKNNDVIVGSGIAFEQDFFPKKGKYFMVYSYEDGDKIHYKELGGKQYDYFTMDWYQIPKLLKQDYWSEPYYDKNGGDMMMSTFSHPLYNSKGEFIAIFTADISLDQFTALVEKLSPYDLSYSFMLSRHGYYITHNDKDRIMNQTIFSNAFESNNIQYEKIGHDMIEGKNGTIQFNDDGENSYAFYTPIPDIGWSLCNVCPASVILQDLYIISRNIIFLFIVGVVLLFVSTFKVIKNITRPLEKFSNSAKEIATGRFDVTLPSIKSHDEMETLHHSFAQMQESLSKYIDELKTSVKARERINSELHIARKIQMGMLPKIFPPFPERNDINLHAVLNPAKEVGGDLYDFFIENERLYFVIGDVSGKGVPASLVMAITSSVFRSIAHKAHNPEKIVSYVNKAVCESNESNMFVTLIVGILDLKSGEIRLCNAGHNPLILINPNDDVSFVRITQNLPLGIISDFDYKENILTIEPCTKLVLYTDGVTEAENDKQELYSEKRLLEALQGERNNDVQGIINDILMSISRHVNMTAQSDDLAILVIDYKPQSQADEERIDNK
ncbi:MAG: SpoIIE family protein phosphatase [Muribaculaceae bacterium]